MTRTVWPSGLWSCGAWCEEVCVMWDKLRRQHPLLYEAINWGVLVLSAVSFCLALGFYMAVTL